MMRLTRFDGSEIVVNVDQVEFIEGTPDTVISLMSSRKILVRESVDEVISKAVAYKQRIFLGER